VLADGRDLYVSRSFFPAWANFVIHPFYRSKSSVVEFATNSIHWVIPLDADSFSLDRDYKYMALRPLSIIRDTEPSVRMTALATPLNATCAERRGEGETTRH
jgi:hypothetical protein